MLERTCSRRADNHSLGGTRLLSPLRPSQVWPAAETTLEARALRPLPARTLARYQVLAAVAVLTHRVQFSVSFHRPTQARTAGSETRTPLPCLSPQVYASPQRQPLLLRQMQAAGLPAEKQGCLNSTRSTAGERFARVRQVGGSFPRPICVRSSRYETTTQHP